MSRLMSMKNASIEADVSYSMITYWVGKGHIQKFKKEGFVRQFYVDVDDVLAVKGKDKFQLILAEQPDNLITPEEASELLWVVPRMISYYVKKGYVKAHYVFGNDHHYLVDREEIKAQARLIEFRTRHQHRLDELREQERNMKKDSQGRWTKG
jgi:predicted site-specific integrase-resolvase